MIAKTLLALGGVAPLTPWPWTLLGLSPQASTALAMFPSVQFLDPPARITVCFSQSLAGVSLNTSNQDRHKKWFEWHQLQILGVLNDKYVSGLTGLVPIGVQRPRSGCGSWDKTLHDKAYRQLGAYCKLTADLRRQFVYSGCGSTVPQLVELKGLFIMADFDLQQI